MGQVAQHTEARNQLRKEINHWAESFQAVIQSESEARHAIVQEVVQLKQVIRDLEGRIDTKSTEVDRLLLENQELLDGAAVARQRWHRELNFCMAPLSGAQLAQ